MSVAKEENIKLSDTHRPLFFGRINQGFDNQVSYPAVESWTWYQTMPRYAENKKIPSKDLNKGTKCEVSICVQ